jgi:hypothetical protein
MAEEKSAAPLLTDEELQSLRWKMDLTDAQVAEMKESMVTWPKTHKAVSTFGEALLKEVGLNEEQIIKISRLIGPVLHAATSEASERAWAAIDRIQEKLAAITKESDEKLQQLEAEHQKSKASWESFLEENPGVKQIVEQQEQEQERQRHLRPEEIP